MSMEIKSRTFISYSRVDQDFALNLAKELKEADFPIWFDQFDIPLGKRWDDEVEEGLRKSEIFLVILTPASVSSDNVKDEIGLAISLGKLILPVLLEECDVPLRLNRLNYVDFTRKSFHEGIKSAREILSFYARTDVPKEKSQKRLSFTDARVANVAKTINDQIDTNDGFFDIDKFILAINILFSRKTFRYENLKECPEQRWADRLDSAYQTRQLLQSYEVDVQMQSLSHYSQFEKLVREVDGYCMDMGSLLFEPPVNYNFIEDHIGKHSFKEKLPKEIRFPTKENNQPIIPNHINDPIEKHRLAAISWMDRLLETIQKPGHLETKVTS